MRGAASVASRHAGRLQSRTRSGLSAKRSRCSSHSSAAWSARNGAEGVEVGGAAGVVAQRVEQQVDLGEARGPGRPTRPGRRSPRRGRGPRCRGPRRRPGGAGGSVPPGAARSGSWAPRTRPCTAPAGGAARRPARPTRCPRAAGRCAGRPCPRSRTSPCGRRRCPPPPARRRRRPRRWGSGPARSPPARPGRRTWRPAAPTAGTPAGARHACRQGRGTRSPAGGYRLTLWTNDRVAVGLGADRRGPGSDFPRTDTAMNCSTAACS